MCPLERPLIFLLALHLDLETIPNDFLNLFRRTISELNTVV